MRHLESFLCETIGLDAAAVGRRLIARAGQQPMAAPGVEDESESLARQLALLLERRRDTHAALTLRRRAERILPRR